MTQPEPTTPPVVEPTQPQAGTPTPPWGSDENFDPAKAWSLITNLRSDVAAKNGRIAELTPFEQKAREAEEANKSEVQRLTEQLAASTQTAAERAAEALRLRIALKYKIADEDAEVFLTGATEEQLTKQAERLAAMQPQASGQPAPVSRTPVEALRPGALPNPPAPTLEEQAAELRKDPHKNAKALLRLENSKLIDIATNLK